MDKKRILSVLRLYGINLGQKGLVNTVGDKYALNLDHQDLEDLEFLSRTEFQGLIQLSCSYNELASLDYELPELEFLTCRDIGLKELDLSKFPKLRSLDCSVNKLKYLDLSQVPNLEYLICSFNKLEELDLPPANLLRWVDIEGNRITDLDIKKLPNLEFLDFRGNPITTIDRGFAQPHDIIVPRQLYRFLDQDYMHAMAYFLKKAGYKLPREFYEVLD